MADVSWSIADISWNRLAHAINFYRDKGYTYTAVPWAVPSDVMDGTIPPSTKRYKTLGGELVGSGEQSFMQMLEQGADLYKAVCCTPCFRAEPVHDEFHLPYFMKVELIIVNGTQEDLADTIEHAILFLRRDGVPSRMVDMGDGTFDLVGDQSGIELGSFGIREWRTHKWVYGTGLAEPRTSQVKNAESRLANQPFRDVLQHLHGKSYTYNELLGELRGVWAQNAANFRNFPVPDMYEMMWKLGMLTHTEGKLVVKVY